MSFGFCITMTTGGGLGMEGTMETFALRSIWYNSRLNLQYKHWSRMDSNV